MSTILSMYNFMCLVILTWSRLIFGHLGYQNQLIRLDCRIIPQTNICRLLNTLACVSQVKICVQDGQVPVLIPDEGIEGVMPGSSDVACRNCCRTLLWWEMAKIEQNNIKSLVNLCNPRTTTDHRNLIFIANVHLSIKTFSNFACYLIFD